MGEERAAIGERLGVGAQPRAQGVDDRAVGDGGPSVAEPQRTRSKPAAASAARRALADPGLAAEQDDRALARAGPLGRLVQPGELIRPPDQRVRSLISRAV